MAKLPDRRGFALLIVLWTMVLIAFIVIHLTMIARSETRIAANLVMNAAAEAAADGAVYEAVFRLIDQSKERHWEPSGRPYTLNLPDGQAEVQITDENSKINPNIASIDLLSALLRALKVPAVQSASLAAAIAEWRTPLNNVNAKDAKMLRYSAAGLDYGPPSAPFESDEELGLVAGMTPEILAVLEPHISLYADAPLPDSAKADQIVVDALKTLASSPQEAPVAQPKTLTVSILVSLHMKSGARFRRHAIIKIDPSSPKYYRILVWDTPNAAS